MNQNCRRLRASLFPPVWLSSTWVPTSATCCSCWQKPPGERKSIYFEALPSNVEQMRRNGALNGMEARVTVIASAVTQSTGPVRFLVHSSGGMGKAAGAALRKTITSLKLPFPGSRWMNSSIGRATRRHK